MTSGGVIVIQGKQAKCPIFKYLVLVLGRLAGTFVPSSNMALDSRSQIA